MTWAQLCSRAKSSSFPTLVPLPRWCLAVAESHLAGAELERVAGGGLGVPVVALVLEGQRDELVDAPGHFAVHCDLVRRPHAQVRVALAGHAAVVDLRVRGDVHAPLLSRRSSPSEARQAVLSATKVEPVSFGLKRPAAVLVMRHDGKVLGTSYSQVTLPSFSAAR